MSAGASHVDVAIAGGGLIGLASAWYLCEAGYRVAIADAGPVGRQASWAGGGILFPIYPWKYPLAVQRLAQRGRAIYDDFTRGVDAWSGIDSENRRTGLCVLDPDEFEAAIRWARSHDEPARPLDRDGLAALQGGLTARAAVHFPQAAQVRNPRLCRSLKSALVARGVCVLENRPVTGINEVGGRFAGFETDRGTLAADRGVVACGAWSGRLLGSLCPMPVFPVKGQMILLQGRPGLLAPTLLENGRYVIPRADGRILVGSTVEHAAFDQLPSAAVARQLHAVAAAMMPGLSALRVDGQWAGLRPATRDEIPLIGAATGIDELYVNTGHYRNGVLCAPASAELLLGCMGLSCSVDASAYAPTRAVG